MTPIHWNPYDTAFAQNEASMLDWEGNIKEPRDRKKILLSEVEPDLEMESDLSVSAVENKYIDSLSHADTDGWCPETYVPVEADEVKRHLSDVSPVLDAEVMSLLVQDKARVGNFMTAIGSTDVGESVFLSQESEMDDEDVEMEDASISFTTGTDRLADILESVAEEGGSPRDISADIFAAGVDIASVFASSVGSKGRPAVDAKTLSKLWRIDLDAAKRTLEVTTQHQKRTENPKLSRNYGTGDRMLRYKRIKDHFYMDTFYASARGSKSTRQNTCCQLFVTDKGFVYVVPMRSESQVLHAVKQFAKEIGAPDAIICDAAKA